MPAPSPYLAAAGVAALLTGCGGGGSPAPRPEPPRPRLIVLQRSIDRLSLGMTPAQVRRGLGRPARVERLTEAATGKAVREWIYPRRGLVADFRRARGSNRLSLVTAWTISARQRTASGLGVGSTEGQLLRRIDGLRCGVSESGERRCSLGESPRTVFVIRGGRVTEVRVLVFVP